MRQQCESSSWFSPALLLCLLLVVPLTGGAAPLQPGESKAVSGEDERKDVYEHPDASLRTRAQQSTVALMDSWVLDTSDPDSVAFYAGTLRQEKALCPTERFLLDPAAAFCSGTLIDDDLVLTAGHCIADVTACSNTRFVFNYYRPAAGTLEPVSLADVFSCGSLVVRQVGRVNGQELDYAVVRLDRPATPRFTPAPMRLTKTPLAPEQSVTTIGSEGGVPFKIDSSGLVFDPRPDTLGSFLASTGAFEGSAGSGVYDTRNTSLVGILSDGQQAYVDKGQCRVADVCRGAGCSGKAATITYVSPVLRALCSDPDHVSARLCSRAFVMQRWVTKQGGFWDAQKWMAGDFNGDGKDDVAKVFDDGGGITTDVHLSTGSSFTMQRWETRQGAFWAAQKWMAGDFNGDGKEDLANVFDDGGASTIDVHLSTGSSFTMRRWATRQGGFWDAQKWMAGDFNGDGKDDLANVFDEGGASSTDVHLSSGSSFSWQRWSTRQGWFWDAQRWMAGNFHGDGKEDLANVFNEGGASAIDVHSY
jgi:hypothetical protein